MIFYKMENEENDFVVLNMVEEPFSLPENDHKLTQLAQTICQSHRLGIGADGLVLLMPPIDPDCDYKMRIFNADGTEAPMCGNASACIGKLVKDLYGKTSIKLETYLGVVTVEHKEAGIQVDLGEPVIDGEKDIYLGNKAYHLYCISICGIPHAVTFIDGKEEGLIEDYDISEIAPFIEKHPEFTDGTNVDFVQGVYSGLVQVKFWERGVGETNACGTGSCAVLVASSIHYEGDVDRDDFRVEVFPTHTPENEIGGIINVSWSKENNHLYLNECRPSCKFMGEFKLVIPEEGYRYPSIWTEVKTHIQNTPIIAQKCP